MKCIKAVVSSLLFASSCSSFAHPVEDNFINRVAKEIHYAETHQQMVWPGFHPNRTATIVQIENIMNETNHFYALNFKPGKLPWQKWNSSGDPIYFLSTSENDDFNLKGIDEAITRVEDQDAYVAIMDVDELTNNEQERDQFMQSRAMYYTLYEAGLDPSYLNFANIPYDAFNHLDYVKLLYLEDAALSRSQQQDPNQSEEAMKDAVAIHQYRNNLLSTSMREFETIRDLYFGVSSFIALSTQNLNDVDYRKKSQRVGCPPLVSLLGPENIQECVMYQFSSYASAVYGRMLDKKSDDHNWKSAVQTQDKGIAEMAIDHYHFSAEEAKHRVEQAIKNPVYEYNRIEHVIHFVLEAYIQELTLAYDEYVAMPGIPLNLHGFNFDVDYSCYYQLNARTRLFKDVFWDDDDFYLDHLPYLSETIVFKNIVYDYEQSYISLKLSEQAVLTIDGKEYHLPDFIRLKASFSFNELMIVDQPRIRIKLSDGTISANTGILEVMMEDKNDDLAQRLRSPFFKLKNRFDEQHLKKWGTGTATKRKTSN